MNYLEMSLMATILIVLIIIIRKLFLNKLPKGTFPILWLIVLLRLIFPFSIPLGFGINTFFLQHFGEQFVVYEGESYGRQSDLSTEDRSINTQTQREDDSQEFVVDLNVGNVEESATINWNLLLFVIWIIGAILCASYFTIGYFKSYQKIRIAIPMHHEFLDKWLDKYPIRRPLSILVSDQITTPMTIGILKPKIILPESLHLQPSLNLDYILAHELYHIKRFDSLWKLIAIIASCFHWFNPFVWMALVLANRDLEISCDAWVLRNFSKYTKKSYAYALISLTEYQNNFSPLLNGFARHATTERVESIMRSKKTTIAGSIVATIVVIFLIFHTFAVPVGADVDDVSDVIELFVPLHSDASGSYVSIRLQEVTTHDMTILAGDFSNRHRHYGIVPEFLESYLQLEDYVAMSANIILEHFEFNSDGLMMDVFLSYNWLSDAEGHLIESYPTWLGWLLSEDFAENPTSVPRNEQMIFFIQVCAVTGEVLLIVDNRDGHQFVG